MLHLLRPAGRGGPKSLVARSVRPDVMVSAQLEDVPDTAAVSVVLALSSGGCRDHGRAQERSGVGSVLALAQKTSPEAPKFLFEYSLRGAQILSNIPSLFDRFHQLHCRNKYGHILKILTCCRSHCKQAQTTPPLSPDSGHRCTKTDTAPTT